MSHYVDVSEINQGSSLDAKRIFAKELAIVQQKLETRSYASAKAFAEDFAVCFRPAIELNSVSSIFQVYLKLFANFVKEAGLSTELKDTKKLAKRILKAVQGLLTDALQKEANLAGLPFEDKLAQFTTIFNDTKACTVDEPKEDDVIDAETIPGAQSRNNSSSSDIIMQSLRNGTTPMLEEPKVSLVVVSATGDLSANDSHNTWVSPESMIDLMEPRLSETDAQEAYHNSRESLVTKCAGSEAQTTARLTEDRVLSEQSDKMASAAPMTPPRSEKSLAVSEHLQGGIPWYFDPFDIDGTDIHEERWTGREVLREMSEELSEIDEEELRGMGKEIDGANNNEDEAANTVAAAAAEAKKVAAARRRKRNRR